MRVVAHFYFPLLHMATHDGMMQQIFHSQKEFGFISCALSQCKYWQ